MIAGIAQANPPSDRANPLAHHASAPAPTAITPTALLSIAYLNNAHMPIGTRGSDRKIAEPS